GGGRAGWPFGRAIGGVLYLLCADHFSKQASVNWLIGTAPLLIFDKLGRRTEMRLREKILSLKAEQRAELGVADTCRILQHGQEYRLQVARRAGDDLQHLAGRGLLLQGLGQIVGTLTQFIEQPRVFDRNDCLGGEVLYQFDLLVGERPDLLPEDRE